MSKAKKIAETIAQELMYEYEKKERIHDDRIEKECYYAVADLKGDIKYELEKILKSKGYTLEE